MKKILLTSAIALTLTACGGGSGGGSDTPSNPTPTPPPEPTEVMPIGLWQGTVSYNDGSSYPVTGVLAPDGEGRFLVGEHEQSKIKFVLDGDTFTSDVAAFENTNGIFSEFVGNGTLSGDYTTKSIDATATFNGQQTSTISLTVHPESANGASFEILSGNYTTLDYHSSIAIDTDGVISGSDNSGCQYYGKAEVPDESVNVYTLELEISSCGELSGNYSGMATYTQIYNDDPQKGLFYQFDNGKYSLTNVMVK